MLGSFGSSPFPSRQLDPPPATAQEPPTAEHQIHVRQLLLCCAQLISRSDFSAAHRLISILSGNSSPYGDSSDRLVHSFTKALSLRLQPSPQLPINHLTATTTATATTHCCIDSSRSYLDRYDDAILQSSYLSFNQITPFLRFSQLTANQAILEAIDQSHHQNIHILDFNIMHGVQWPPLMQAIAGRYPPPTLRITSTGTDVNILRRTGDRLSNFADSLGLRFRFYPILLPNDDNVEDLIYRLSGVILLPDEILAVNCVLYLHRLLNNRDKVCLLLRKIKAMNPKVVTLAEREANHNHPIFMSRFAEALMYYTAVFESLEATLPPASRERMEVEQVWLQREISDIVAAEGGRRRERHERFRSWDLMMRNGGFVNVSLSPFAVSQAKLLLRLHYPCEGYNLELFNDSFFLGWRNQPLFSVSSWR